MCRFGTTYTCEQRVSSMKLIDSKTRSRLTDSNNMVTRSSWWYVASVLAFGKSGVRCTKYCPPL